MAGLLKDGDVLKGTYEITGTLGEGAFGVVYRARDAAYPDVEWAIKEVSSPLLGTAEEREAVEQFQKECAILKRLSHPGLPAFIDYFTEGRGHYLVMELIDGQSLQALLNERAGPYSFEEIRPWLLQLLDILHYLHSQSPPVVFRDLKPSNIMVTPDGKVKLIDFGIARLFSPEKLKDTFVMGTPGFSAPEQYGAGQTEPRSDVYSLGATVYYLLSKEYPDRFSFKFPPVTKFNAAVPARFARILERCLEANPGQRYQSCSRLLDDLGENDAPVFPPAAAPQAKSGPTLESAVKMLGLGLVLCIVPFLMGWFACFIAPAGWALIVAALVQSAIVGFRALRGRQYGEMAGALLVGILCLFLAVVPALAIGANVMSNRNYGQSTACKSNLKNLGTALEMYSTDNRGRYPASLSALTPNYLKTIPTCAAAGADTYSEGYVAGYAPDAYTVVCAGSSHSRVGLRSNYPQYNSTQGLIDR